MKRYFVWKDGKYNGENTEWKEISGREYYELVNKPENSNRLFIHHKDYFDSEADEYFYEATRENYMRWDRMRKKEEYELQIKLEHPIEVVSLDTILYYDDDGAPITLADEIPEPEPDPMIEELKEALNVLTSEERELIDILFLNNDERKSERQIANELGIPNMTLNCRKRKILQKLRSAFVQN